MRNAEGVIRGWGRLLRPALVCALAGALTLAGCQPRPITITVWDGPRWADESGDEFGWIREQIALFRTDHPDVNVILVEKPWAQLAELAMVAARSGRPPDLAPLDISAEGLPLEFVREGYLEPLNPAEVNADDLFPGALAAYTVDGRLYGVPVGQDVHVLLLNRARFVDAQVPLPPGGRWTWDAFRDAARRLTRDTNEDAVPDTYGFGAFLLEGYYEWLPFLYADGARTLTEDGRRCGLDGSEGVSALERLVTLVRVDGTAHPDTGSSRIDSLFQAFAFKPQQIVAISPWGTWAIAVIQSREAFALDLEVAEYPIGATGRPVTVGRVGGWVAFGQDDARKRAMVMELLRRLSGPDAAYTTAVHYGTYPVRRSVLARQPFAGDTARSRAAAAVAFAEVPPRHREWPRMHALIVEAVRKALAGDATPADALAEACAGVERVLRGGP